MLSRIERRKQEVAAVLPKDLEISVAATNGSDFWAFSWPTPTYPENGPALLREVGVKLPDHQREAVGSEEYAESDSFVVSPERIELLDGQRMVLFPVGTREEVEAKLSDNELWQSLKAVRSGRVRWVESHWLENGPLAQLAILDNLEEWFGGR